MVTRVVSFSLKKGVPKPGEIPSDSYNKPYVINVTKTITNPFRVGRLRKLNGLHPDVVEFIRRCKRTEGVVNYGVLYGQSRNVLVGCYGGQHRSVAIAEMIAEKLRAKGCAVEVIHRDLRKEE